MFIIALWKETTQKIAERILADGGFKSLIRLVAANALAGFFVAVFFLVRPVDFENISEAKHYKLGSTLYGVGPDGEYAPMAEFYRYRRVLLPNDFVKDNPDNKIMRAFRAMEDASFEEHFGLDIKGIIRAFFVNLAAGRIKEGASTITQQAARLKFLTLERSFVRKFREMWLAFMLEANYEKHEIMEVYLNEVPMGHGNRGVVAAAEFYFGKKYTELDWGEAALLASLTSRPNYYSPLKNPIESRSKVKVVFRRLFETGELTKAEVEAEWQKLEIYYRNLNRSPGESAFSVRRNDVPWFAEYIRTKLEPRYGRRRFYEGGLQIYTSLDIQMQKAAQEVMQAGLKKQTLKSNQRPFKHFDYFDDTYGVTWNLVSEIFGLPEVKSELTRSQRKFDRHFQKEIRDQFAVLNLLTGNYANDQATEVHYATRSEVDELLNVEGALITIEVKTGKITAMIGGSAFNSGNQLIRAVDAYRQPGSSFKPILYASAMEYSVRNPDIENPVTAATLFNDTPKFFLMTDGFQWEPQNYSGDYQGFILLRRALELSKNMVAIQVPEYIGLKNIHPIIEDITNVSKRSTGNSMARRQPKKIPYNYSIALGSFSMTPLEMASAYAIFPNQGKRVHPISILKVTDSQGQVVDDFYTEHSQKPQDQIVDAGTAKVITSMLRGVVQSGTGTAVKNAFGRPAVGKTGTTDNQRDAWFVGYTPTYATAVWLGYDRPNLTLGKGGTGGGAAAPLWGRYMAKAMKGKPVRSFEFPGANTQEVEICKISGQLPNTHCNTKITEMFHGNNVPTKLCNDHYGFETETVIDEPGIKIVDPYNESSTKVDNNKLLDLDDSLD